MGTSAGKTTTTDASCIHRRHHKIGEVHDGAATMDWMEQEQERGSRFTSAGPVLWRDGEQLPRHGSTSSTPGRDFTIESTLAARARRGAWSTTRRGVSRNRDGLRQANKTVPARVSPNKMTASAPLFQVYRQMRERLSQSVPIQIRSAEDKFEGVVDW